MPSGLLQTRADALDVLTPTVEGRPGRNVARAVDARMARQSSLTDDARRFRFVLTEQAIRCHMSCHGLWANSSPNSQTAAQVWSRQGGSNP
ncbi:MAG: Scr1 family TA system antitoxin-like transcriptional regulator [Thermocrispum sp.]